MRYIHFLKSLDLGDLLNICEAFKITESQK